MENTIEPNTGLFIWQIVLAVIIIFSIVIVVKFYKKIADYIDLKTKYLKNEMKSKE